MGRPQAEQQRKPGKNQETEKILHEGLSQPIAIRPGPDGGGVPDRLSR
jgi:hypothetical protein